MISHLDVSDTDVVKDLIAKGLWLDVYHWVPPGQILSVVIINNK